MVPLEIFRTGARDLLAKLVTRLNADSGPSPTTPVRGRPKHVPAAVFRRGAPTALRNLRPPPGRPCRLRAPAPRGKAVLERRSASMIGQRDLHTRVHEEACRGCFAIDFDSCSSGTTAWSTKARTASVPVRFISWPVLFCFWGSMPSNPLTHVKVVGHAFCPIRSGDIIADAEVDADQSPLCLHVEVIPPTRIICIDEEEGA